MSFELAPTQGILSARRNPTRRSWIVRGAALGLMAFAVVVAVRVATRATPEAARSLRRDLDATAAQSPDGDVTLAQLRQMGGDESWWQTVSADIERQEYVASPTPQGLQAPNRAHNLRTTFGEHGIEVVPRTGKDAAPAWRFVWETTGFGRPGRMKEVSPSAPSAAGARVVYQRDGWSEWYENTAKGLEQGFTVDRQPDAEGPLKIAGSFPEAFRPEMREDGAVDFLDQHGACAIRYGELHVWDAKGREIDSRLAVEGTELAILVEDDGAAYPLIVDPLMTSPAWTNESNQASASFGRSVATAGDVNGDGFSDVIVGANAYDNGESDEGRAFVYHGSGDGLSTTPAWTAESNQGGAAFGFSVATAGDVNGDGFSDVIVGAHQYDNGETDEGRAFVYHGSPGGLAATPAWTVESGQASATFGRSVTTAGDVNGDGYTDVIVGAPGYDNGQGDEGRAFAYYGSAAGLATTAAWATESNQVSASFGFSVATVGDVNGDGFSDVIVGAYSYDNGETDEGRAFVYHGSAAGLGTTAAWTAESNQASATFGWSVATAGDVNGDGFSDVIVGAMQYDNGETNEGRAFAYHGSAAGLATTAAWTTESNQAIAFFGNSVATAGDVNGDGYADVIVGANGYDNVQIDEGRAHVYLGSGSGLSTTATWTARSQQASAFFGASVATAGDVNGDGFSDVIVGAVNYDNGETDEGRAFVYHGSASGLALSAGWAVGGNQSDATFGWSVATAGDVNGDGFSDVIVGEPYYDNGPGDGGRVHAFLGSPGGLAATAAWTVASDQAGAEFGWSVGTAGDVNGDGFSDVIVGAIYRFAQSHEGRAFVFHGSPGGLATTPAWTAQCNQLDARFGFSVGTAGDVNGDGFSDAIVGAPNYDNGEQEEGRAFVYHGSTTGLVTAPSWVAEGNAPGLFGYAVGIAGDVNGDGFSDVIVGSVTYGQLQEGRAQVYHGSASGLASTPAWTSGGQEIQGWFGGSAATAGDVNGDGFSDVIVGQYGARYASVFPGSAAGLGTAPWNTAHGSMWYSVSLGTAGDVNGDGFSDVIVGDPLSGNLGRAIVLHGSATGPDSLEDWVAVGNEPDGEFGWSVATAGDVNGDGFSDVIIGADFYDGVGRAFIYYGNGGDGPDRNPRQARTSDSAPIWPLGISDSESAFRLKAFGRTAAGRGDVRLQFEVKPAGIPFDGTGLVTGSVTDTGVPTSAGSAVPLTQLASGLTPATLYHWRLRVLSDSPFFPRSPWMWLPYNGTTEADVRTKAATTAVGEEPLPTTTALWLAPGAPNPFNPRTTLSFLVPARTPVRLAIHDVQGRLVRVLVDEVLPAGQHAVEWDGRDSRGQELATGVYLSRLEAGGEVRSRKLALVK